MLQRVFLSVLCFSSINGAPDHGTLRKLKPDARLIHHADDRRRFCSAADCRLTVFQRVETAREIWCATLFLDTLLIHNRLYRVKGRNFTIPLLLNSAATPPSVDISVFENSSLAIFRLAPADYHRYHSPADVIVGDVVDVEGCVQLEAVQSPISN